MNINQVFTKRFGITLPLLITAMCLAISCRSENPAANQSVSVASNINVNAATTNTNANVAVSNAATAQRVEFQSADGLKIVGTYYGVAKADSPAVLMLHQWGSTKASYEVLAKQFQASGIAALAIDGRGFGESVKRADGSPLAPSRTDLVVAGMKADVTAAIKFLKQQPSVDANRIGITGASYGSSLAIIDAADDATIKAVALLSPGTNYFGNLPTEPAVTKYGTRPLLIVAADDDAESAVASGKLNNLAKGEKHQLQIYPKGGHGTGLFAAGVGLEKLLGDFFAANL
ncbi:MAG: dienelactone hydrolase family protein [Pyrinomonadaceae bacterium]